ncbi:MAG: MTH1187 family thiamine-binding protein [Planctomycetota bacterium]
MKAVAEIQVIPIGVGVSVRKEVQRAHRILVASGLTAQLHANGTNVEGDLDAIFEAVKRIHEVLHAEGTPRLATNLKIGTRTDKEPDMAGKLFEV